MNLELLKKNIENARHNIKSACERAGRDSREIKVMAVTKTHPVEYVKAAILSGLRLFGENRVREAYDKYIQLDKPVELHLIGHLQRNKAKTAVRIFECIQSIDRIETAEVLDRYCKELGRRMRILLEVNTSGEDSKHGFRSESDYFLTLEKILKLENLKPEGLMTIGPFTQDKSAIRKSFAYLKRLLDKTQERFPGLDFSILSMGMSGDYEIAIEEGSTLIRIGTALFSVRE